MELAGSNHTTCLFVTAQLIIECNTLDRQIIALFYLCNMFLEEGETTFVRISEFLIKLVKLHEYTGIGRVECISLFEQDTGTLLVVAFIVVCQCTPYRGEGLVDTCREFPALYCLIVTTGCIPEVSERIGRL